MATANVFPGKAARLGVPPLRAGDNLSKEEFLRRWDLHPEIKFAELIGGIVFMPSPLSVEHGGADLNVATWLGTYKAYTPGCSSVSNATTFLLDETAQPDLNLYLLREYGGRCRPQGKFLAGSPELLVEICASSAVYDLHQKFHLYEAAKVQEYLAVLLHEQEIRWHTLVDATYQAMPPQADGMHRSRVFPGLWLDGPALLSGDLKRVLERLGEGLKSPEHETFVQQLAEKAASPVRN